MDGRLQSLGAIHLPVLQTREVARVLEATHDTMVRYLRRRGLLDQDDDEGGEDSDGVDLDPLSLLCRLTAADSSDGEHGDEDRRARRYRPWADLLKRTFHFDVRSCPRCEGRMRLLAMVIDPKSIARYLRALGEPTGLPVRAPARGPPFWQSRALRRTSDEAAE